MRMKPAILVAAIVSFYLSPALAESSGDKAKALVEAATESSKTFAEDANMSYLHENLGNAQGLLIVPRLTKVGFIIGGSGGKGVLLRKLDSGEWSYPAFYTMGSGTIGAQIGGEVSEIILMIMTKGGMDSLLSSSFKLGTDASVAAGPVGVGAKAAAADILAFSRTKGAFAGVSFEGSVIKVDADLNAAYYGKEVRTSDIFILRGVSNPHADVLRQSVVDLVKVGG